MLCVCQNRYNDVCMCWCFVLSCVLTWGFSLIICRTDHNLQDIRAKIFPLKRRKVEAPEVTPTNSLPVKKEKEITIFIGGQHSQSADSDWLDWKENKSCYTRCFCCWGTYQERRFCRGSSCELLLTWFSKQSYLK